MNNERYSRHFLLSEIGVEGQERLAQARVLLVGVGGLGSPIALYLAAAGVGRIGLVDNDVVGESNLQRQVLYAESEVGQLKTECAARRLSALNSAMKIDTYPYRLTAENAASVVGEYDLVVDGCDNFATRYVVNDVCVRLGKPYVYGAIGEFRGQVSVFNYQGGMTYRDLYPDEAELTTLPQEVRGVMGVVPGIVGTVEATEVIKLITGCGKVLRNRLFTIDVLTMEVCVVAL